MNLRELTREWLRQHGYDGLFHVAAECGCHVDDLMPCSEPGINCQPGHLAPCDCGEHDYHLTPRRKWTANPIGTGEETTA